VGRPRRGWVGRGVGTRADNVVVCTSAKVLTVWLVKGMTSRELVGGQIGTAVFPRKSTLDERGWATIWHGNRLPDVGRTDSVDILLL